MTLAPGRDGFDILQTLRKRQATGRCRTGRSDMCGRQKKHRGMFTRRDPLGCVAVDCVTAMRARMKKEAGMRTLRLALSITVGVSVMVHAATRKVDFTQDAVGQPPTGFEFGHTAGVGSPGKWVIQADGDNKVLAQADADSTRSRFPVAVLSDVSAADVDLSVRFRPISGGVDQAAGLVWRYRNQDNYYVVRANALEDNVVLYKVEGGKRTDLPVKGEGRTYGKKGEVPARQWSTLRVVATGRLFEVYFGGAKLYEVEDATFAQPGKVGVWTKADSVTQFDDLTVVTK